MDNLDQAVAHILSSSRVLLKQPGALRLNDFYPTSAQAVTKVAQAINANGRYRITSNNLALGSASNFSLAASSMIYGLCINVSLTTPANSTITQSGWLFSLISSIEFTISNSQLQNMILSGTAMREYILLCCSNPEDRTLVLANAGLPTEPATTVTATVPIGWLLSSGVGLNRDYPLDMATLNGPIQIQINWNTSASILVRNGAAPGSIAAFNSLNLSCSTTDLLDGAFAVRNVMMMQPSSTYNIHAMYINSVRYFEQCQVGVLHTMNINSCPAGMLEGIVMCIKPSTELTGGHDQDIYPGSVGLSSLRLTFGGQDLYRADTAGEIVQYARTHFDGDALTYSSAWGRSQAALAANYSKLDGQVIYIPLGFHGTDVLRGHHVENLPSYSGANLQLSFTPANRILYQPVNPSYNPFIPISVAPGGGAGQQTYLVELIYLLSAIVEISNSVVEMQL